MKMHPSASSCLASIASIAFITSSFVILSAIWSPSTYTGHYIPDHTVIHKPLVRQHYGRQAIFYEAFFSKHEHWLIESSIVSEEMIITLFRRLFPQYFFITTYFGILSENINDYNFEDATRLGLYRSLLDLPCGRLRAKRQNLYMRSRF